MPTDDANELVHRLLEGEGEDKESAKDFLARQHGNIQARRDNPNNRKVVEFEIEDIGIENTQYFQGRGTAFTQWDDVFVGTGDNPHEALDDALDTAAQSGWNVNTNAIVNDLPETPSASAYFERLARQELARENGGEEVDPEEEVDTEGFDLYYYVAFWVKGLDHPAPEHHADEPGNP